MKISEITNFLKKEISWEDLKRILVEQHLLQELSNILYWISIFLNDKGEIVFINNYFSDILGYKSKNIVGKKVSDYFVNEEETKLFLRNWKRLIAKPHTLFIQEIVIYTAKRGQRIINWHFLPLYLDGKFKTVFSVGEDITETALLEKKLKLKCNELKEKNKKLTSVIKKLVNRELQMKEIKEKIRILKEEKSYRLKLKGHLNKTA